MTDEETKSILKERAKNLAREPKANEFNQQSLEIVEFKIEKERYGIETQYIEKVHHLEYLTPIPGLPAFMIGIINVHGQIIPVLDIKVFFNIQNNGLSDLSKAIIVRYQQSIIGILADEIFGVIKISNNEIQTNLPSLTGIRADYLKGITLSQTVILDPVKLALDKRIIIDDGTK